MARMSYALVSAALAAACLFVTAQAQQPTPPPFATTKVDGTDNVYIFRYGNAQSMFVVTSEGVIATDPIGYGPPAGGHDLRRRDPARSRTSPSSTSSTAITTSTTSRAASPSRTPAPPSSRTSAPRSASRC